MPQLTEVDSMTSTVSSIDNEIVNDIANLNLNQNGTTRNKIGDVSQSPLSSKITSRLSNTTDRSEHHSEGDDDLIRHAKQNGFAKTDPRFALDRSDELTTGRRASAGSNYSADFLGQDHEPTAQPQLTNGHNGHVTSSRNSYVTEEYGAESISQDYAYEEASLPSPATSSTNDASTTLENDGSMIALLQRTGYTMIQENGQRRYGGPPPGWQGAAPTRGCEIFVGKIPRDLYEDELVPLFETVGPIYELRLMMDFGGTNRGYAFVMYTRREDARRAIKSLNNFEVRKGKLLGVCPSVDNCRLFVGGIPRDKMEADVREQLIKMTEGVVNVILYPSVEEKSRNRGYAFVEYDCHKSAAMARRKLVPGKVQLWGKAVVVDWAEPEVDVDEEILENAFPTNFFKKYQTYRKQVKILYVRNLMLSTTEEKIKECFQIACNGDDNSIERVKKIKDYAFIHYLRREDALCALEAMNGKQIDGTVIEVSLAKPIDQSYYNQYSPKPRIITNSDRGGVHGETRSTFYAANGGGGLKFGYQNNSSNSLLGSSSNHDDGSFTRAIRGAGGLRGNPLRLRGYRPQREKKLYENREKTNLIYGFSKHGDFIFGKSLNVLEDFCHKLGWKCPEYKIDILKKTDSGNKDITLYIGKVRIYELNPDFLQASQMGLTAQEAKLYAADFMLSLLRSSLVEESFDAKNYEGNPLYKIGEKGFVLVNSANESSGAGFVPAPAPYTNYQPELNGDNTKNVPGPSDVSQGSVTTCLDEKGPEEGGLRAQNAYVKVPCFTPRGSGVGGPGGMTMGNFSPYLPAGMCGHSAVTTQFMPPPPPPHMQNGTPFTIPSFLPNVVPMHFGYGGHPHEPSSFRGPMFWPQHPPGGFYFSSSMGAPPPPINNGGFGGVIQGDGTQYQA